MKKIRGLLIALLLVLSLVGCTGEPPVISGVSDKSIARGTEGFDLLAGISVLDAEDGDLSSAIIVKEDNGFDPEVGGDYEITVAATDSSGQEVTATFTVTVVLSEDDIAALEDLADIQLDVDNLVLPTSGENGSILYWTSGSPDVITDDGFVIRPGIGEDAKTVVLTVKVMHGDYREEHDFELTVQPNQELTGEITTRDVAFEGTSEEYVVDDVAAVPLYFIGDCNLPYMDIETFLNMLDGAMDPTLLTYTPVGTDVLEVSYSVEWEDFDGSMVTESYLATIDFTANTFTVNSFDFFGNYVAETSSDYGEGLTYTDAVYGPSNEVTIPLGFYNFDIMTYDDGSETQYLMPVHVLNLLFMNSIYYDVYYNGDQLYGVDTFTVSGPTEAEQALLDTVRTSSYNSLIMPDDIKFYTYNFYGLALDYFYGLRYEYDVDSYFEILSAQAEDYMLAYSDTKVYSQVFKTAYDLDDLHTSHAFTGYYEEPYEKTLYLNDIGAGTLAFYEGMWDIQDKLEILYGTDKDGNYNVPESRVLADNKTAVFWFDGFDIDTPDAFHAFLEGLDPAIENVVIDLSYNTGGNVGAVFRMFGYMTEETFMYHSMNPADGSTATYYIESDYVAYDYNWFINTSSVTFSAANLMTAMAKEQGIATIIGQDASGGASSIGTVYSPDGSCLIISTNSVTATLVDGEYVSVEDGVEVEYQIYNPTSDQLILEAVQQALADQEATND